MKKIAVVLVVMSIMTISFLAGYLFKNNKAGALDLPSSNSQPVAGVQSQESESDDAEALSPGMVQVNQAKQQMMGIKLGIVKKGSYTHLLKVPGRVAADETKVYRINAAIEGWITKIFSQTTGSRVKKDELLALYSSPNFLSAQQAYLYALAAQDRANLNNRDAAQQLTLTERNIQQYRDTLRTLGMTDTQIGEIAQKRQYTDYIQIRSPGQGFIMQRNVSDGLRFDKGAELYRIADLDSVWILADVYENEDYRLSPGKSVDILLPGQNKRFKAQVSDVLPQFDAASRTLKVRLDARNPGYLLRPDMFVDVELPITAKPAIYLPAETVLDTGIKKTVFVARGQGIFEPRRVETGRRLGELVEIEKGLREGERVVLSGNFLLDAESKLELSAAGVHAVLEKDPVCAMDIAPRKAQKEGKTSRYLGTTYYFCSDACKQHFERNPEEYLKKSGAGK